MPHSKRTGATATNAPSSFAPRAIPHPTAEPRGARPRPARLAALLPLALAAVLALTACAEESKKKAGVSPPPAPAPVLEIIGDYRDNYGDVHAITANKWTTSYSSTQIVSFDNDQHVLIGFLGSFQDTFGGTPLQDNYSRFDWTRYQGDLYYCQSYPYVASADLAADLPRADDTDPTLSGCGVFSWTKLYSRMVANRAVCYAPKLPSGETVGAGFYDAALALGLPGGSTDVASLGDDGTAEGGALTLGFGVPGDASQRVCIVDDGTAAADFVVFENPFAFADTNGAANFTEAAYVEVSEDGSTFYRFAATAPPASASNIAALVGDPANYSGVAGINTLADGGDVFDLGALIAQEAGLAAGFRACYVRLVDGGTALPDYDAYGQYGTHSPSGADIDAVEALHYAAAAGLTP